MKTAKSFQPFMIGTVIEVKSRQGNGIVVAGRLATYTYSKSIYMLRFENDQEVYKINTFDLDYIKLEDSE